MNRITANEAIRLLTEAGHKVTRNRRNAPGYLWNFDYSIDGKPQTVGSLRNHAMALPLAYNITTGRYELDL